MNESEQARSEHHETRISGLLVELLAEQRELNRLLREDAEKRQQMVAESIALQKQAVRRFRLLGWLIVPVLIACIGLLVILLVRYPGLLSGQA